MLQNDPEPIMACSADLKISQVIIDTDSIVLPIGGYQNTCKAARALVAHDCTVEQWSHIDTR
jgi:hypothetical protein